MQNPSYSKPDLFTFSKTLLSVILYKDIQTIQHSHPKPSPPLFPAVVP